MHAQLPQHRHGIRVFDAFSNGLNLLLGGRRDQRAYLFLQIEVTRQALDQRAVDLDEVERQAVDQCDGMVARTETFQRKSQAVLFQRLGEPQHFAFAFLGQFLNHLEADALRLCLAGAQLQFQPVGQRRIEDGIARQPNKKAGWAFLRREIQRCADDPAIDIAQQVVALGGRHEIRRQHFLAGLVEHAHHDIEHLGIIALQAGHRLLHELEAILDQRRLDVFHPDRVVS